MRAGTASEHDRVDALFSKLDLSQAGDYRLFLTAQAFAFLPVEQALDEAGAESLVPDWPQRRRAHLLRADLAALGVSLPRLEGAPELSSAAEVLGALYVLEGSRLGGAMLRRTVAPDLPQSFLSVQQPRGGWRKLLETVDRSLSDAAATDAAVAAAQRVFQCFESGGRRVLEG